jgi:hypothetical protein
MENQIEIEYKSVSVVKRFFSKFVDLFIIVFTCFVFFSLSNMFIVKNVDGYKNLINTQNKLKIESNLYLEDGTYVIDYVNTDSFTNYESKKDYLSSTIEKFYTNQTFFNDSTYKNQYYQRAVESKDSSSNLLFKLENEVLKESNLKPEDYYNFYKDEIENHCIGYLFNNSEYSNCTRLISLSLIITAFICLFISYVIYRVVLPLTCFKKGKQTLGMKLFKISYVGVDAFSVSGTKYALKSIFDFIVYYLLNIVSFLIPLIISTGMMFLSKSGQDLSEYIFNVYPIDTKNDDVYTCYLEYLDGLDNKKRASIENNDFKLK